MKNTGTTDWGFGVELVHRYGDAMNGPASVGPFGTSPGGEVDISVDLIAPDKSSSGVWQLRHGTTYFGPELRVDVRVPDTAVTPPQRSKFTLTCLNCPSTVTPGQTFRPRIRVDVTGDELLGSRGDMLRSVSNPYGAWPQIPVNGRVRDGQSVVVEFSANDPMRAPQSPGSYASTWRLWRNGNWVGDPILIRFDVGGAANSPPDRPQAQSPAEWAAFNSGGDVALAATPPSDPDGDAVSAYYFDVFDSHDVCNSGWISSNSWRPTCLGFWSYQWRVKVRDSRGGESGWSETRHFQVNDPTLAITSFYVDTNPRAPWLSGQEGQGKYVMCASANNSSALKVHVNLAPDGSDRGEWKVIGEWTAPIVNTACRDDSDHPPTWGQLEYESGTHLFRLFARGMAGDWAKAATRDLPVTLPQNRRPSPPFGVSPGNGSFLPSRTVNFDWIDTWRTTSYHLEASASSDFSSLLLDQYISPNSSVSAGGDAVLPSSASEFTYTFDAEYSPVYWRVTSSGPYGSNESVESFTIDETPPASQINTPSGIASEENVALNWGGVDTASGLRWYDVQVREGNHPQAEWKDWLVNTTKTAETFRGKAGMTYYFRVRAMDAVGNWEEWPSGDGDAAIRIDPWAVPPPAFWDSGYSYRRNLLVLNQDSDTMPAGFPLRLYFDGSTSPTAAEIYAASRSPDNWFCCDAASGTLGALRSADAGDDLRIVYNNSTELNRVIEYFSPNRIEIMFPSQEAIGGGGSSSGVYQLYYGNANSDGAPHDVNEVFLPKVDGNTIGLWHFQEGYGNFVGDASSAGYNGSFNSPGWEVGFLGMAGVFNGSDSVVRIGRHYASDNIGPITIEGWFKQTKAGWGKVVMKGRDGGGQYFLGINGDRNPELVVGTTVGSEDTKGGPNLEVGRWYHIAVTHNGSNEMNVYVNGIRVGGNNNTHPLVSSSDSLYLGNAPWWGGQAFGGSMQHVRISNIARTDFPYARIDVLPQVTAGAQQEPAPQGASDLVLKSLNTYPNPEGGNVVEAVVANEGVLSTRNAFYTDIFVGGLPQNEGDAAGSVKFWVNDAVGAGETVTLTAVLSDVAITNSRALRVGDAPQESTVALYTLVDSMGSTGDADRSNNSNGGAQICVASADAYDGLDELGTAYALPAGTRIERNFSSQHDDDWVAIDVVAGRTYVIQTTDLGDSADTVLELWANGATEPLLTNDDYNGSMRSLITWTPQTSGRYYAKVHGWNPAVGGCGTRYTIRIDETAAAPLSTPIDPSTSSTLQVLENMRLTFPAGTFADSVIVTFTPVVSSDVTGMGNLRVLGAVYNIEATYISTGEPAQPQAGQSYYIEIGYDEAALGGVDESTIRLYTWNGTNWVVEPTSQVDTVNNRLMARPTHFSLWALGALDAVTPTPIPTPTDGAPPATLKVYVPLVMHTWSTT